VATVRFIKEAQKLGFTLSEVEILLHLGRGGPADCEAVRALATEKLLNLESRVASLKAMHHSLDQLIATCEGGRASAFLARYLGSQLRLVRGGCCLRNRSRTGTNSVSRSALDVVGHEIQFQTAQATPGSRQRPPPKGGMRLDKSLAVDVGPTGVCSTGSAGKSGRQRQHHVHDAERR
jgi:hypothetical protein